MFDDSFNNMSAQGQQRNGISPSGSSGLSSPNGLHHQGGFMRQQNSSHQFDELRFQQQQQRFQPHGSNMNGLESSMNGMTLHGGNGMYGGGTGKPPAPPPATNQGGSMVYGHQYNSNGQFAHSSSPYGQMTPQQLQLQQEQLYQQQVQLQQQYQPQAPREAPMRNLTLNRAGSSTSTMSGGSLDEEVVTNVKDEGNLFGNGSGLDLLNNVRNDFNSQASSSPLESSLWGSAPTSGVRKGGGSGGGSMNEDTFSRTAQSFSPPKSSSLLGQVMSNNNNHSSSSLNQHRHGQGGSISPCSSKGSISPIGTHSPNRVLSRSPVSVLSKNNSDNSERSNIGTFTSFSSSSSSSLGDSLLSDSLPSHNVKVTANSSALTTALALDELNAASPRVTPSNTPKLDATKQLDDDDSSSACSIGDMASLPTVSLPLPTLPGPQGTPPVPMTTEQILMLQEQLRQQQALIAGQNELLKALLAQQQVSPTLTPTCSLNEKQSGEAGH